MGFARVGSNPTLVNDLFLVNLVGDNYRDTPLDYRDTHLDY